MKRWVVRLIGWLVATVLLVLCLRTLDRAAVQHAVEVMQWRWIAVALLANALILVSWAGLWWSAAPREERPPFATMLRINAVASSLMNTLPFFGGHVGAVVLMNKRAGMSHHAALSVIALDQLGEGVAKVTLFGVVACLAPIPEWMRGGIIAACVIVGLLLIALLVVAHRNRQIAAPISASTGVIAAVRVHIAEWAKRLETLRSVDRSATAYLFAVGTKVAEGAGLMAVQHAVGVDLTFGATALVLAAVILGSMVPVAPGNVGTYEAAAFLAYRHLGVEPGTATILAGAAHLCFLIPSIGVGYLVGAGWLMRRDMKPAV